MLSAHRMLLSNCACVQAGAERQHHLCPRNCSQLSTFSSVSHTHRDYPTHMIASQQVRPPLFPAWLGQRDAFRQCQCSSILHRNWSLLLMESERENEMEGFKALAVESGGGGHCRVAGQGLILNKAVGGTTIGPSIVPGHCRRLVSNRQMRLKVKHLQLCRKPRD